MDKTRTECVRDDGDPDRKPRMEREGESEGLKRRTFLALAVGAGLAWLSGAKSGAQGTGVPVTLPEPQQRLPSVPLGKTGIRVSRCGMGGAHIPGLPANEALKVVRAAYDSGITYFDTASQYGDGKSEELYGSALSPVRKRIVIATKTLARRRAASEKEIEGSLSRLKTDAVDILQIHAINDFRTWEEVASDEGALRAVERYKKAGAARFTGITGHRDPEVLLRALKEYPFDTVLLPVSGPDAHYRDFGPVIDFARNKGVGVIGMKLFADGKAVGVLNLTAALRYALSRNPDTAIIGFGTMEHVRFAADLAKNFKPMTQEERLAFEEASRPLGNTGVLWWKR